MSAPAEGGVTVRPMVPGDRPALLALMVEVADHWGRTEGVDDAALIRDAETGLDRVGAAYDLLVAERDGGPIGFAAVTTEFPGTDTGSRLFLKELFVGARGRGSGAGTALLARIATMARERGIPEIDWTVFESNTGAIALYDRLGARAMPEVRYYRLDGAALDALAARDRGTES